MGLLSWLAGNGGGGGSYTPDDARADNDLHHQERHIATSGDNDAIERRAMRRGLDGYNDDGEWVGF